MHLSPRENEKLMIVVAADLAWRRQKRGLKLNHPESVAILPALRLYGGDDAVRHGDRRRDDEDVPKRRCEHAAPYRF